jgi:prolyl-tRNA editing enzyme YbaK/EbsC (Cys-tRNA(Pro) deacylase)
MRRESSCACLSLPLRSAVFVWVPTEYYTKPLTWRRDVLNAPSTHHLCKTIVLENTHCVNADCSDPRNSRYYMAVYQYVERFDAESIMRFIQRMNAPMGKKKFNFRLADPAVSAQLTGFGYNAVVPFGTVTPIPIILSHKIVNLSPPYFWMGGGHVDCKLRADVTEFVHVFSPFVTDFTTPLPEDEWNRVMEG